MESPLPFAAFEAVEHTADLAFLARGRTPAELLEHAALALVAFLYDREAVKPQEVEEFELVAADPESLLVSWLQEILYRHEVRHRLYHRFRVAEAGPSRLRATAWGEPFDPDRHEIWREIKAATYHDLAIGTEESAAGDLLRVQVVLDI